MAEDDGWRPGPGLPPMLEGDVIISPEDVRVGYPPQCTAIDEGAVKNLAFLDAMKPEEAQKYMGEWIAVADGEIVAHGKDPGQVCQEGSRAGKGGPHMRYIYAKPEEGPGSMSQSSDLPHFPSSCMRLGCPNMTVPSLEGGGPAAAGAGPRG